MCVSFRGTEKGIQCIGPDGKNKFPGNGVREVSFSLDEKTPSK